ncbi:MAG: Nudix family hydrolase [Gammaproteobacteria bacterium]|nr:Nudix family hydrolase [Gammaproteobacteria bacterium]
MHESDAIRVAVGVVMNDSRQILISRRPADRDHGGCWEFPGGKIKPGETAEHALLRELQEELNLTPLETRPLIRINHCYTDYSVILEVFLVRSWKGEATGLEGQSFKWVAQNRLSEFDFPAANGPILKALELPEIYFITPEQEILRKGFLDRCEKILAAGCRMVQFRSKQSAFSRTRTVFDELLIMCRAHDSSLLLNGTVPEAVDAGADGCHLSSNNLRKYSGSIRPDEFLIAASCHDGEELELASSLQLDFAVLGPVRKTGSHPVKKCLGWPGFCELSARAGLPVYAIGGMQLSDLETAWLNGGHGLACISAIWQLSDNDHPRLPRTII